MQQTVSNGFAVSHNIGGSVMSGVSYSNNNSVTPSHSGSATGVGNGVNSVYLGMVNGCGNAWIYIHFN